MENLPRAILRAHPQASAPINGHVPRAHDTQVIWLQFYTQKPTRDPRRKKGYARYVPNRIGVRGHGGRHVCYLVSKEVPIQIMEANNPRVNACKPAVKSTKYQVISTVATVDENCPLQLWSRFLPHMQ